MEQYKIQKNAKNKKSGRKKIVIEGYEMKPKLKKHKSLIDVERVVLVSPKLHELALKKQFNTAYKKMFKKVILVLEESDTSVTSTALALDEVAKMKAILKEKYKQYISKEEYKNMWKKVSLLQLELQNKQAFMMNMDKMLKNYQEKIYEEERGHSR